MCVDDFKVTHGQYTLEIDEEGSVLGKFENKKFTKIASF